MALPARVQDGGTPPADDLYCKKFNNCHKKESKDRIDCPECKKQKISADDKFCYECSRKKNVCKHCGRDPEPKNKGKAKSVDEAIKSITNAVLMKTLSFVASDEVEGRCAGYPGHDKVVEYFTKIYKDAGLKPVGEGGTYLQWLTVGGKKAANTVALLEGTSAKDEIVILGGHHDHIGRVGQLKSQQLGGKQGNDDIFNGADDNGSGCTCIVEIARAFGQSGLKPKRSILFITFTGEEWGLIGSKHYCDNPIFPIGKTIAMINMDMVGRNSDKPVSIRGLGTEEGDEFEKMCAAAAAKTGLRINPIQASAIQGGDSDHTSFKHKSIPVMFFDAGIHADWHKVTDSIEKINFDQMTGVARTAMLVAWDLANSGKTYKFADPDTRRK